VKSTVFLDDLKNFVQFNELYGEYFDREPPSRSTFQVAGLPLGAKVEIEMIALVESSSKK
jgi:enamine deaminase RidA (YjgF/YER057c/UK114 family)